MKFKNFLLGLSLMTSFTSWAGGDVGNGGVSVVCRDNVGRITSAELLDVFEGRELYGRKYRNEDVSVNTKIELSQQKLSKHPGFLTKLQAELEVVKANLVFVKEGIELNPTNDALPTISKKGCNYEQVANYTNEGEVLVSQEIYSAFDVNNKAALFVHEAVYALRRKLGDKTSQKTRRLTAHLLAGNGDQNIIDQLVKASHRSGDDGKACGVTGSVDERIIDCNFNKGIFALVARTEDGKEVYKDKKSGLLWGDRLPSEMDRFAAAKACNSTLSEVARISEASWRLPKIDEFKEAEENGIRNALPNMNYLFLSSTKHDRHAYVWVFDGDYGQIDAFFRFSGEGDSVRCMGRY